VPSLWRNSQGHCLHRIPGGHQEDPDTPGEERTDASGAAVAEYYRSSDGIYLGYSGRTVAAIINNDSTSGKGTMADLERLNVYFRKVPKY